MKDDQEIGRVYLPNDVVVWDHRGWSCDSNPWLARVLTASGIGESVPNAYLPDAYERILREACDLIHGRSYRCGLKIARDSGERIY